MKKRRNRTATLESWHRGRGQPLRTVGSTQHHHVEMCCLSGHLQEQPDSERTQNNRFQKLKPTPGCQKCLENPRATRTLTGADSETTCFGQRNSEGSQYTKKVIARLPNTGGSLVCATLGPCPSSPVVPSSGNHHTERRSDRRAAAQ